MSLALESSGLMKKSCSALQYRVPCLAEPGPARGVSSVCCMHPAVVAELLFPSVQSSAAAVLSNVWSLWY